MNITAEEGWTIIYNSVQLNNGSAYDESTGRFICPNNNVYYFGWSIHVDLGGMSSQLMMGERVMKRGPFSTHVSTEGLQGSSGAVSGTLYASILELACIFDVYFSSL